MNGTRYLLDTNAVIAIVNGNEELLQLLNTATFVAFSVISIIEFLSFPGLSGNDKSVFEEIVAEGSVIDLDFQDKHLMSAIVDIRKLYRLKLPDAILAATALSYDCQMVSNDNEFQKVTNLQIIRFSI